MGRIHNLAGLAGIGAGGGGSPPIISRSASAGSTITGSTEARRMDPNGFLPPEQLAPDFDFRPAWRLDDEGDERDRDRLSGRGPVSCLRRHAARERARELVAVAYKEAGWSACSTRISAGSAQVRPRLAFVRGGVDPKYRRGHIGLVLPHGTRSARALGRRASGREARRRWRLRREQGLTERARRGNGRPSRP